MKISMVFIALLFSFSCKKNPVREKDSSYHPDVSVSRFSNSTVIANPYFPATVGKKYIYEGNTDEGLERVEEQRLLTTKTIMGIVCIIVNFKAWINGVLVEEAWDWYAQDNDGNLWYFGEDVDNYENGVLKDHGGSWEAGKDDAQPGLIMPAQPRVGFRYREEYYFNNAEDEAEIIGLNETVTVPFGTYSNCMVTRNWTALEPDANEKKYYAPGVGLVKEVNVTDQFEIELIDIKY